MGMLPSDWRLANIAEIYTKGNKKELSNYRPGAQFSKNLRTNLG